MPPLAVLARSVFVTPFATPPTDMLGFAVLTYGVGTAAVARPDARFAGDGAVAALREDDTVSALVEGRCAAAVVELAVGPACLSRDFA